MVFHCLPLYKWLRLPGEDGRLFREPRDAGKGNFAYSNRRERGSRSLLPQTQGVVTKGPPSKGVTFVKATSGISLRRPASGKSLRKG